MSQSKIIIEILTKLNTKQSQISTALSLQDKKIDTDLIDKLFSDKGIIIRKFEQWRQTSEAEQFVLENKDLWKEKVTPLLENEEKLQILMKTHLTSLASDLKTIHKGKQVLTYYKES